MPADLSVAAAASSGGDRRTRPAVARPAGGGCVGQTPIVGPEVVAPLGHAMRFVDDEAGDRHLAEHADERVGCEAFRATYSRRSRPARAAAITSRRASGVSIE